MPVSSPPPVRPSLTASLSAALRAIAARITRSREGRPLALESLEPRANPAVVTVNTFADVSDANVNDGVASTTSGGSIVSLRAAIMQASWNGGDQTIILPAGTYNLDSTESGSDEVLGDLDVWDPLGGSSPNLRLVIMGDTSGPTIIRGSNDRVLQIVDNLSVEIHNVTITGGQTTSSDPDGGGLYISGADVAIYNTAIHGNATASGSFGGHGGGVFFYGAESGSLTIVNSTIANNSAAGSGGGVYVNGAVFSIELNHITVTGNESLGAGGLHNENFTPIQLTNSIVWDNFNSEGGVVDLGGLFTSNSTNNVIGRYIPAMVDGFDDALNRVGSDFDPLLGAFALHGGFTPSFSIGATGGATDYGYSSTVPELSNDQRNSPRPFDGDGDETAHSDAGAFEIPGATSGPETVSGTVSGVIWFDENFNGVLDAGEKGLKGVVVKLYWSDGTLIAQTKTNAQGEYSISRQFVERPDGEFMFLVALAPKNRWWSLPGQANEDADNDFSPHSDNDDFKMGFTDPFLFQIDGYEPPISSFSINFPPVESPPSPFPTWVFDGGLYFSPESGEGEEPSRDDFEIPPVEYPEVDTPDPFDFFYKVPTPIQAPTNSAFSPAPVRQEVEPSRNGEHLVRGEQAYLNVYKVVEVGRRRFTERIAMMVITDADPNLAQGVLGAAAPGRYRITVQDRIGEEIVWEGDLPFSYDSARTGVQKAWKTVRERVDSQRDEREAPVQTPPASQTFDKSTENQPAPERWSEEVERMATMLSQLDLIHADK